MTLNVSSLNMLAKEVDANSKWKQKCMTVFRVAPSRNLYTCESHTHTNYINRKLSKN